MRHPMVVALTAFIGIYIIAALFAVDKYSAFWGALSRAEGVVGVLYLFLFFALSTIIFEKKDWIKFFKVVVVVSFIVLIKEYVAIFNHIERPGSSIGNPAFLSGYLLFAMFSAGALIADAQEKIWKFIAWIILPLALVGIVFTQTRGTIVGVMAGILGVLIFGAVVGNGVVYKKVSLRVVSIGLIVLGVGMSGLFIVTRQGSFWRAIPGVSRLTQINFNDGTTGSRILVWKMGLEAANPKNVGAKKFLIGWGPENFYLSFEKYYDPHVYNDDNDMFDRPHNKLVEVLVTTGLVGLTTYLVLWFFLIKYIGRIPDMKIRAWVYFVSIAYFVHLMFLFDVFVTWIGLLTLMSFIISMTTTRISVTKNESFIQEYSVLTGVGLMGLVSIYAFFASTLPAYAHMRKYVALVGGHNTAYVIKNVDSVLVPHTYVDTLIVGSLLNGSAKQYGAQKNDANKQLLDKAIQLGGGYIQKRSTDYRLIVGMINALNSRGDGDSLVMAEKYTRLLIDQVPGFPRYQYMLALNLGYQKKFVEGAALFDKIIADGIQVPAIYDEYAWLLVMQGPAHYDQAFDLFEHAFSVKPELFGVDIKKDQAVYVMFKQYFVWKGDKTRLEAATKRLADNS